MAQRDAVDVIVSDHRHVEALFSRVETGPTLDQAVLDELIRELSIHAAIEEQVLYPAIRKQLPDGDALAEHALDEHQQVKETLADIDGMDPSADGFDDRVTELATAVKTHVKEEEGEIFPQLRKAVTRKELVAMGEAMEKAKKGAPTRPHPKAPATPPGNIVAGAAAGVVDRARDAARDAVKRTRSKR